jgi:hypothetical protein
MRKALLLPLAFVACSHAQPRGDEPSPAAVEPASGMRAEPPTGKTPEPPRAMSRVAFTDLVRAMDEERSDEGKLRLLRATASRQWFTSAMAGVILDHVPHRESKLAAVPLLKDRLVDRENAYWLYQHFTFREDKAKVQEMLEH